MNNQLAVEIADLFTDVRRLPDEWNFQTEAKYAAEIIHDLVLMALDAGNWKNLLAELQSLSPEDIWAAIAAKNARLAAANATDAASEGKIFPGDGSVIKQLWAAFQAMLPVILPYLIPKSAPQPASAQIA
jgi:hypothetical protein